MKRTLLAPAVVAAVALATVAGCGSGAGTAATPSAAGTPAAAAPGGTAGAASGEVPALSGNPTDLTAPTQAAAGTGQPPATLVTQDVVVGAGPAAVSTDTVNVRYTGTLWADGSLFDSSWSRGAEPISFPLNRVVPGFAQGIEGMAAGGRRVIVIPPDMGYGDADNGPIPGGSTLVFVVDLVAIG